MSKQLNSRVVGISLALTAFFFAVGGGNRSAAERCGATRAFREAEPDKTAAAARGVVRPEMLLQVGHRMPVTALAVSLDGQMAATGGNDGAAWLWNLSTGRQVAMFHGTRAHSEAEVSSVAFSPDGQHLLMTYAGQPELWEIASGCKLQVFSGIAATGCSSAIFSPDGQYLLTATDGNNGRVRAALWNASQARVLHDFYSGVQNVTCVAFSADSKRAAIAFRNGDIHIRDCAGGGVIASLSVGAGAYGPVVFHPDNRRLMAGAGSRVCEFDIATGQKQRDFDIGQPSRVYSLDITADGKQLAVGTADKQARVIDVETGNTLCILPDHRSVLCVRFTPDGRQVLTADDYASRLRVWSVPDGQLVRTIPLRGHRLYPVTYAAFVPNSNDVVTRMDVANYSQSPLVRNAVVTTWSLESASPRSSFKQQTDNPEFGSACLTPDGRLIAQIGTDNDVVMNEVATGRRIATFHGHTAVVDSIAVDGSGKHVLTGSDDGTARLWNAATGEQLIVVRPDHAKHFDGNDAERAASIEAVAFSPDANVFATGCPDNTIALWNAATGAQVRQFGPLAVPADFSMVEGMSLAFSPDGKKLASLFVRDVFSKKTRAAVIWNVATGEQITMLYGDTTALRSVAFSPDSRVVAVGAWDSTIRLYDLEQGKYLRTLAGHSGVVSSIDFSSDGKRLVSSSADGTAILWDVESGWALGTLLALDGGQDWMTLTPDGYFHGSEAGMQAVSWKIAGQVFPLALYEKQFHRPALISQRLRGIEVHEPAATVDLPPTVRLTSESLTGNQVRIVATARAQRPASKISAVHLYIDGRDVADDEQRALTRHDEGDGSTTFRATVSFPPGKTKAVIAAVVSDDGGVESQPAVLSIIRPGPPTSVPRTLHVLAVGVSRYKDSRNNLRYGDKDAEALVELLAGQKGLAFANVSTSLLVNEDATVPNIRQALQRLHDQVARQDVVIILFSGHGARSPDGVLYYVPFEADGRDLAHTLLPWDDVARSLQKVQASSVLFLCDCCHAGAFGRQPVTQDELTAPLLNDARVMVFAASRGLETAEEQADLGHGAFTYAILQGLGGAADLIPDKRITISELQTYVADSVKKLTNDQQHPHIPRVNDFDPELVLAHVK